jgi:hypothetical protein
VKSACTKATPSTGAIGNRSIATTFRRGPHLLPGDLGPSSRRRPEIHDHLPGAQQLVALVDLEKLVGRARAQAFLLRALHVGVVNVAAEPLFRRRGFLQGQWGGRGGKGATEGGHTEWLPRSHPRAAANCDRQAHKLNALVIIGDKGLTDEVVAEIDRTLKAHELIKVRAATDDRRRARSG